MNRDDFPFRNRYSPPGHQSCTNPLCLVCLCAERDHYILVRSWPQKRTRLYIVRRQEEKKDDAA